MRLNLLLLIFVLTAVGCGSKGREALLEYRATFAQGEFDKAAGLLKKVNLEKMKDSQLLRWMEYGRLAYARKDFAQAINLFTVATELIDAQYRKSVSIQGGKWLLNERSGEFFGATYERSWLFYHLALSHWRMYQEGGLPREEARKHLFSARAALLAWDSFFQEWQRGTGGKSLYRHDIAAKVVAGQVHEATGVRADLQISLQLYKDAYNLLNSLGPSYPSFNTQAAKYEEALTKDGKFSPSNKNKEETIVTTQTKEFLRDKIIGLTLILRANEMPEILKQFGFDKADVVRAKTMKPSNVTFILEEGTMPAKVGKEIILGMRGLANLSDDPKTRAQILQIGGAVMATFAVDMLGLGPSKASDVGRYVLTRDAMAVAAPEVAIDFEIPEIPNSKKADSLWLVVKTSDGKEALIRPWSLMAPVAEIGQQTLAEESGRRIIRTGVRVAMKHAIAIVAAYALYKSMNSKGDNEFFAKLAAVASYVAATKGIAATERADTRSWATLPRAIRLTDAALPPGEYDVSLGTKAEQNTPGDLRPLGKITVAKNERAIFTYLVPQL
mgnify:FL=1